MKSIVGIFSILFFAIPSLAEVTCEGYRQFPDLTSKSVTLEVVFETAMQIKLVADIGDIHYLVNGDKTTGDYYTIISKGPEYIEGSIASGTFNSHGQLKGSWVIGSEIFKIVCKK